MAEEEAIISGPLKKRVNIAVNEEDELKIEEKPLMEKGDNCSSRQYMKNLERCHQIDATSVVAAPFVGGGSGEKPMRPRPNAPQATETDKKRRKVVVIIALVTFVLLVMSVLLMIITIQFTPSINEKIRKEHEKLMKQLSEGVVKQNGTSSGVNGTRNSSFVYL